MKLAEGCKMAATSITPSACRQSIPCKVLLEFLKTTGLQNVYKTTAITDAEDSIIIRIESGEMHGPLSGSGAYFILSSEAPAWQVVKHGRWGS